MTTRARRPASRLTLAGYSTRLEEFLSLRAEAEYRQLAGLETSMGLSDMYAEHAGLFETPATDWLRGMADGEGDDAAQARELLAFAAREHVAAAVAELTDRIATAEATAVIMWRGEPIPYRAAWNRATDIANRAERNGMADSYLEAVEAINPMRQERLERTAEVVRQLGYADLPDMVSQTAGFDPAQLAADLRAFLADSETVYYAAQRRTLAEIDIEHGDGSRVDLDRVLRGAGWDSWFPARGMLPTLRATLAGMGIDLDGQRAITLDVEPRDRKSARSFCAPVQVPGDVRLVIQPHGGWDDYAAALHEAGHAEHYANVAADLPAAYRLLGDSSLTEGYGLLLELLVGEPDWLMEAVGMPEAEARAFADFHALSQLAGMRSDAAQLIYEL